jgi:hypothetical protein
MDDDPSSFGTGDYLYPKSRDFRELWILEKNGTASPEADLDYLLRAGGPS